MAQRTLSDNVQILRLKVLFTFDLSFQIFLHGSLINYFRKNRITNEFYSFTCFQHGIFCNFIWTCISRFEKGQWEIFNDSLLMTKSKIFKCEKQLVTSLVFRKLFDLNEKQGVKAINKKPWLIWRKRKFLDSLPKCLKQKL